ncbi:MAG: hypothetical protein HUJ21_06995 [Cyclobacterium sp.]|nr:hypothetical protein [Cyclobacterium sp.]
MFVFKSNESAVKKQGIPSKYIKTLHFLLGYHLLFVVFFTAYIHFSGGDSYGYWHYLMEQVPIHYETWNEFFGTSTTFILWLNYIPSRLLGLGYFTGNFLYGILGFIGLRYLFILTAKLWPSNYTIFQVKLFPLIFFLPNLHFWSAGVGKDAICFWGIAWFLYAIQNYKSRWLQGVLALFFVYMARPHMGFAFVTAGALAVILGSDIQRSYKIFLVVLGMSASVYLSSSTLSFLKIDDFSLDTLEAFAAKKAGFLNEDRVGSAIDISSYSLPYKLFTYMYRPLFFDAHNIMSFLSGFENILYLWLSFFTIRYWKIEAFRDMPVFLKTGIIAFIPIAIAFSNSLSNLGIIMRMKNMTMIYFVLFCFFLIAYDKKIRYLRYVDKQKFYLRREKIIISKKKYFNTNGDPKSKYYPLS